jgi:hypothetical protein
MRDFIAPSLELEEVMAHSFKDFHVKGFDYLCLRRSPEKTVKLYLFEGDVSRAAEVVNPHDHRYDFDTLCLAGSVRNHRFCRLDRPPIFENETAYEVFAYRTPLNGGNGFTHIGREALGKHGAYTYAAGQSYRLRAEDLHTIEVAGNETMLVLTQYHDVVPLDQPTVTFTTGKEPPSLSGLYSRMTADDVLDRLRKVERVTSLRFPILA